MKAMMHRHRSRGGAWRLVGVERLAHRSLPRREIVRVALCCSTSTRLKFDFFPFFWSVNSRPIWLWAAENLAFVSRNRHAGTLGVPPCHSTAKRRDLLRSSTCKKLVMTPKDARHPAPVSPQVSKAQNLARDYTR
jgi:hypothetical protein